MVPAEMGAPSAPAAPPAAPEGCLHTTVRRGCSAASPPGGRRGAPVTKRRNALCSSGPYAHSTSISAWMGGDATLYPWSNVTHSDRSSGVHA